MAETYKRWKRPESVPYPSVWSIFEGLKEINGAVPIFWVQDIPEDHFEAVVNIMFNGFCNEEVISKYSKVTSDPESAEELKHVYRTLLQDRLALICYMKNPNPNGNPIIAGVNLTHLKQKDEMFPQIKGKSLQMILDTVDVLEKMNDPFKVIGSNELLSAVGLYVLPEFRGQGLGFQILKTREPLCKAVGIKGSVTIFSVLRSQILAAKVGFQDLSVVDYVDLQNMDSKFQYPGIEKESKDVKYMYKIF